MSNNKISHKLLLVIAVTFLASPSPQEALAKEVYYRDYAKENINYNNQANPAYYNNNQSQYYINRPNSIYYGQQKQNYYRGNYYRGNSYINNNNNIQAQETPKKGNLDYLHHYY